MSEIIMTKLVDNAIAIKLMKLVFIKKQGATYFDQIDLLWFSTLIIESITVKIPKIGYCYQNIYQARQA